MGEPKLKTLQKEAKDAEEQAPERKKAAVTSKPASRLKPDDDAVNAGQFAYLQSLTKLHIFYSYFEYIAIQSHTGKATTRVYRYRETHKGFYRLVITLDILGAIIVYAALLYSVIYSVFKVIGIIAK